MTSDLTSKTICPLPWVSIETSPIGSARPCCLTREEIKDDDGNIMMINEHGIKPMLESNYMKSLRQDMIDGKKPATCKLCWDEEAVGRTSKRLYSIDRFKYLGNKMYNDADSTQFKFIDLKLGNLCNLKCRICGAWSSSKWAMEEIDVYNSNKAREALKDGAWPEESEQFWEDMEELLGQIDYMEITGGEPLMIENHFKLLRRAVKTGDSKRIFVHYNTNGTQLPKKAMEEIWPHFRHVEVAFSIDDMRERFEYQRYPAKWDKVNANMNAFWEYGKGRKNFATQICCTINVFNVFYLAEIADWIVKQPFNSIYLNLLHGQPEWNIKNTSREFKAIVRSRINPSDYPDHVASQIAAVLDFMDAADANEIDVATRKVKLELHDRYRRQSFSDTFPEIKDLV